MGNTPTLEHLSGDRDNNFNLLRFCAAVAVILGHSILLTGDRSSSLGWMLGYAAVNCFFVISGFLVCRSLLMRRDLVNYLLARSLRIYPALIVVVLICVFGLGLWLTQVPADVFLSHSQTQRFLWHNTLLLVGESEIHLPGIFSGNPFPGQVNAPLWTLQYEVAMYLALAGLFFLCSLTSEPYSSRLFKFAVLVGAMVFMIAYLNNVARNQPETGIGANIFRFGAMFFTGTTYYLFRRYIRLSWPVALLLVGAALVYHDTRPVFVIVSWLSLPYLLLFLAYIPSGSLRLFNQLGDYSYGLYILAFPIQQLLVMGWPELNAMILFLIAMALTLPLAMMSWHFVEKPALSLKRRVPTGHSSEEMIR